MIGTPAYMSPEQAEMSGLDVDTRSDVYSLGVVLFELLTGERPFRGNIRMLIKQVIEDSPPRLRGFDNRIPRDLETICLKCLEKDPDKRYADAHELAEELEHSQPATSRNLKVLRDRGLVYTVRQGTTLEYHLADPRLVEALNMLRSVLRDRLSYQSSLMETTGEPDQAISSA